MGKFAKRVFLFLLSVVGLFLFVHLMKHFSSERKSPIRKYDTNHWKPIESTVTVEPSKILKQPTLIKHHQLPDAVKSVEHMRPIGQVGGTGLKLTLTSDIKFEELTLNDPPLEDWHTCASSVSSVMYLDEKRDSYKVGDIVILNITLKDFHGKNKTKGGDVVRILVKDKVNNASSLGYVLDKHDGSYIGVVKLLWAGDITIEGVISTPRDLIRLIYHNVRIGKQRRPIVGNFTRGKNITTMDCTPIAEIASRYKESCNLTHRNADLPWFCEKPKNFSCNEWRNAYIEHEIDVPKEEQQMMIRIRYNPKMNTTIHLKVTEDNHGRLRYNQDDTLVPCNELPAKDTWSTNSPIGYHYNGSWYPTPCTSTFSGSVKSYEKCLWGKRVWLLGDSNMREMATVYMNVMNLSLVTERWTTNTWKKASLASNKEKTISVFYAIHALPRYAQVMVNGSHQYIDSIPAGSNDIVVVHFYMHFQPFHPNAVRDHIRKTAQSVKALKARAPKTTVVVRGSHTFFIQMWISHFNDFWGFVYNQILKEEFASVSDDVLFLNLMDFTAAIENIGMHPYLARCEQAVNYMMAFICPS